MKKFPKTVIVPFVAAFLLAVSALFGAMPGVRAADDKGTSEDLLNGVGKGLSGISKYFWSPGKALFGDDKADAKETPAVSDTGKTEAPTTSPEKAEGQPETMTVIVTAPAETPQPQKDEKAAPAQFETPVAAAPATESAPQQPVAIAETPKPEAKPVAEQEQPLTPTTTAPVENKAAEASAQPQAETAATAVLDDNKGASAEKQKQIGAFSSSGVYLWLPDKGSELERKYGMAAIPAETMKTEGQLGRTDGRWLFVPAGNGETAGIAGLEQKIAEAPEGGNWVGEDNHWVYVFGKQQTYGAIGQSEETAKAEQADKPSQVASAESQPQNEIGSGIRVEPAEPTAETVAPVAASEEKTAEAEAVSKKPEIVEPKAEKSVEAAPAENAAAPAAGDEMQMADATASGEDSGRWAKVGNRWAYLSKETVSGSVVTGETQMQPPAPEPGADVAAAEPPTRAPVSPADKEGHWSMVDGRWVYSEPAPEPQAAPETVQPPAQDEIPAASEPPAPKVENNVPVQRSLPGVAVVEQGEPQPAPTNGLAEQPQQPQSDEEQQKAGVRVPRTESGSGQKQVAADMQPRANVDVPPAAAGPILVFVPGQVPGTGRWYMAPANIVQQMKPVQQNPVFDGGR